jgi:hypothetical protein
MCRRNEESLEQIFPELRASNILICSRFGRYFCTKRTSFHAEGKPRVIVTTVHLFLLCMNEFKFHECREKNKTCFLPVLPEVFI